jgi:hypothetical protein
MLRLGVDVDGVVADFRTAFRALAERELGRSAEDVEAELSKADVERLWRLVAETSNWWLDLPAYEPDQIVRLYDRARHGRWEIHFLTSRPPSAGDSVQLQTQVWLEKFGFFLPAVMTTPAGARGEIARALRLDVLVDDRMVNCMEIIGASNAKALLIARGSNQPQVREAAESRGVGVVTSFAQALDAVERLEELFSTRRGRLVRLSDWFSAKKEAEALPRDPRQRKGTGTFFRE